MSSKETVLFACAVLSAITGVPSALSALGVPMPNKIKFAVWGPKVVSVLLLVSAGMSGIGFFMSLRGSGNFPVTNITFRFEPKRNGATEGTIFIPRSPIFCDVYLVNTGPSLARSVVWSSEVQLIASPTSESSEESLWKDFLSATSEARPQSQDLSSGSSLWGTFSTRTLSDEDARDLQQGRMLMYVLARATFSDPSGAYTIESCAVLQPPGAFKIWHRCSGHNNLY